jgi:hypothetical protein
MSDDTPRTVTVSREALRADLAEMELRLRIYFDDQLKHKADVGAFTDVALRFDRLDRGEWTDTHRRALVDLIENITQGESDRSWSRRERVMGILVGGISASAFLLSFVLAVNGGQL